MTEKKPDDAKVKAEDVAAKGKDRAEVEATPEFVENPRYGVKVSDEG